MRRSLVTPLSCFVLLGLAGALFAVSPAPAPLETLAPDGSLTPRTRAIISGEYAYLLGMPETVVADARIDKIEVSPTGDAVLIAAYKAHPFRVIALSPAEVTPAPGELNLVYWDARTRTARTLLRETVSETTKSTIEQIAWLPQTRSALIVVSQTISSPGQPKTVVHTLFRADTAAGTIKRLAEPSDVAGASYGFDVSPTQPLAYRFEADDSEDEPAFFLHSALHVYTAQGFRSRVSLPAGVSYFTWLPDGKSIYASSIVVKDAAGSRTRRKVLTVVNLETGVVTQPDTLPVLPKQKAAPTIRESWDIQVTTASAGLKNPVGKVKRADALWLEAAYPAPKKDAAAAPTDGPVSTDALLIATNARGGAALTTETSAAILFTRDGSLCAAPVFRLPAVAFEKTLRGIQRTATMTNAKQIGLALMMYSQDYDENLPLPGDGVKGAAGPYVKDPSVFENPGTGDNGFTYSYGGPAGLTQIPSPATTQLGYVAGPGGRAIIWADGHVTWADQ